MQAPGAYSSRPYHHGSLRDSLVAAGVELARAEGPSGIGLRAATRLAGVSHNAAYRHFADHDDLLAAVGDRCMHELAVRMQSRQAAVRTRDPVAAAWRRLDAIGETYVDFAVTETGWFRTAFSAHGDAPPVGHVSAGDCAVSSGPSPFEILSARLDELVDVGAIAPGRRSGLEYAAWAAVHGLSTLLVDGPLRGIPADGRARAMRIVLDTVVRGLSDGPNDVVPAG